MKRILFIIICSFFYCNSFGQVEEQFPDGDMQRRQGRTEQRSIYGKLISKTTGKPVEAASVQVFTLAGQSSDSLYTGMLSKQNGDFRFNDLPRRDSFRLIISALGYVTWQQTVPVSGQSFDKDLGNISLETDIKQLGGVTVSAGRPALQMGIDRKIFNVDKSLFSSGGTAIDAMKNIPSVSVDIEGNVQLRNSPPQIFVDGRPTILTLDQIPADNIERIELITNPSAKFDASSSGGIINIVLKKNKRVGLNGIASVSGGTPEVLSGSLNLNLRQGKFNFFLSNGYNQSGGRARGQTLRQNKENGVVTDYFNQYSITDRSRRFYSIQGGFDYFMDNRNTITISQQFATGNFGNEENQDQEYLNSSGTMEYFGKRNADGHFRFDRKSTRLNYKHDFAEEGKEFTADINYNYGTRSQYSTIVNSYFLPDGSIYQPSSNVRNNGRNEEDQVTFQADYVGPMKNNNKLEAGLRSYHNKFVSFYNAFAQDNGQEVKLPLSNNYEYNEMINAAYFTFSHEGEKLSWQLGLRTEHSRFRGELIDSNYKFGYEYPNKVDRIWDALFPSFFFSKKIGEDDELQLNYTRRINRPRFWQLNPFIEINDPANLQQGNPQLRPEFVNSFELNYSKNYKSGNFLGVLYYRNNPDDITQYSDTITAAQYQLLNNAAVDPNAILNTFINASTTNRYGAEFTLQHKIGNNFDITPTIDLQYKTVKAKVDNTDLSNNGFNWEVELTTNYRIITKRSSFFNDFSFQLTGEYESEDVIPQGRQKPQYSVDFAMKKEFLKDKKAALTLAVNDVFNTDRRGTIYDTDDFYQDSYRRWNVRNFRITFSYKFGDADFSFSKRRGSGEDE
jgi:outer membrane receptor protein involved in Fe transport